ncbi:unnamed protein product [Eruca vesicaria subsp. sativa]|uniref:Zinc finger GRF-type domain-containing protein n=1 Tax=Eruca vesicaria subsp. sativa TaxID=29727 RepID=A0ABC8LR91_ERUVS|nr:unnamed protein product [Eruca vesicaria subsp. sativa]
MSNVSGNLSGSSRRRSTVVGVPKKCWCGFDLPKMSNSVNNPYLRYYRCGCPVAKKLENDDHAFKWIDEGLLEKVETLQRKLGRLEEMVTEILEEREQDEKKAFERLDMKLEKKIFERVEAALVESKESVKRMCITVAIGCVISLALMKFVG